MNKKIFKKVFKIFSIILLTLIFIASSYYLHIRNKIYKSEPKIDYRIIEEEKNSENKDETVKYEEQKGITNILLIGTDARDLNENSRSDSMMIATIDDNSKKLKFTSIMRDSYVNIYKHGDQKINAAYALGGVPLLINTIENNFKIKIDKYVVVNFWGFQDIIDTIGGIDIDIKDYEIKEINKFIGEVNEKKSNPITKAGLQHLDGQQALAYTRIRKVGDGSYERNKRQREVLSLVAKKLQDTNPLNYPSLIGKLSSYVKTNIEPIMIMNYSYTVSKFSPLKIEQLQIPVTELSEGRIYKGSWVLLMDKEQNSKVLNNFIFKDMPLNKQNLDEGSFKTTLNEYLKKERVYRNKY